MRVENLGKLTYTNLDSAKRLVLHLAEIHSLQEEQAKYW